MVLMWTNTLNTSYSLDLSLPEATLGLFDALLIFKLVLIFILWLVFSVSSHDTVTVIDLCRRGQLFSFSSHQMKFPMRLCPLSPGAFVRPIVIWSPTTHQPLRRASSHSLCWGVTPIQQGLKFGDTRFFAFLKKNVSQSSQHSPPSHSIEDILARWWYDWKTSSPRMLWTL